MTLIAAPACDSVFVGWEGDDACTTGSVALNADTSCTAVFEPAFRDVRRPADINLGSDLGGTGHRALNFTGSAGSGGDTWVTLYDETFDVPTRTVFERSVQLAADVLVRQFNNSKGAGLLALYSEAPGKKGLVLILLDNGNSDSIVLATIDRMGKLTRLKSASLGGKISRNEWYRVTMDLTVVGGTFSVVGRVFRHAIPAEPDSALGVQVGSLTLGTTSLSANGLESSGEVGVVAAATSATVDTSVTNVVVRQ